MKTGIKIFSTILRLFGHKAEITVTFTPAQPGRNIIKTRTRLPL